MESKHIKITTFFLIDFFLISSISSISNYQKHQTKYCEHSIFITIIKKWPRVTQSLASSSSAASFSTPQLQMMMVMISVTLIMMGSSRRGKTSLLSLKSNASKFLFDRALSHWSHHHHAWLLSLSASVLSFSWDELTWILTKPKHFYF